MSTGWKFEKFGGALLLGVAFLCGASAASDAQNQGQPAHKPAVHKKKKPAQAELPALPSGPTGPVQPVPLDAIAAVPPQVSFQNNELTIVAPNSTLADILRAVRKQTGAEIDIPAAPERVVTRLGPGPARSVIAELLNGSRFNYVLLGSPADETLLTRVVLVAKSGPENVPPAPNPANPQQPGVAQVSNIPPQPDAPPEATDAEATDDSNNADDAADQQAAEAEQPAQSPDQPAVKTPQQMLQEMQQRQMQLQQQQQNGQTPGSGMPPHPPQEQ
jgi:hypothetical protein